MSNPWDDYKPAAAESNPWDDFAVEDDAGDKSIGMLEAGASMVAGLPSQIAGGLHGIGALLSGKGIDGANKALESTMKSNFGAGAYVPATKTGKRYAENLGGALNKPVEWAGDAGEFVGGDLGRLSGEVMAGTAMALIDPLVIGAGAKAAISRAGKPTSKRFDSKALEAELKPAVEADAPWMDYKQADMFPESLANDAEGLATPHDAGVVGTVEPIAPQRQTRQMELQMEDSAPVHIDTAGVPIRPEQFDAVELAKNNELARMDGLAKEDMMAALPETHRQWAEGPTVFEKMYDAHVAALPVVVQPKRLNKQAGAVNPEVFKEGFEKLKQLADGTWLRAYGTGRDLTIESSKESHKLGSVDFTPEYVNRLKTDEQALEAGMVKVAPEHAGQGYATEMYKFASELGNDVRPAKTQTDAGRAMWNSFAEKGLAFNGYIPKSQRGAIKIDWRDEKGLNQMKKIPGMDRRLKNLLPDTSTPEEFYATHKTTPDVDQNIVQRGFNMLTKGGVYQTMKTDNPLIKRVVDRFLEADQNAKAATQELVHEYIEPLARSMNDNQKADVWAAIKIAEAAKRPLTPEIMEKYGFNQKQMDYALAHQDVMGKMFEKLKESMMAAGLKPVDPLVAYVASRARGDFRRLVYKDGEIVGIFGANTRRGVNKDAEKFMKNNEGYTLGEERYFGGVGKNGTAEGFNQMLEFLSENDPAIKQFVEKVNEQAQKDAFEYMNAKSHTMNKKGIWGMEGNRKNVDDVTNAKEGMRAQIRYAETMIKWSELSKAVKDTKELVAPENGLDMPNAKAYLKDYTATALGNNPTELGRALDGLTAAFGKSTGLGTTLGSKAMSAAKQTTNAILLGLNQMFLFANAVQPFKSMPEMSTWLKSMGLEKGFDVGTGYSYLFKGGLDVMKADTKRPLEPFIKGALEYGEKRHVYASDLFETGGDVSYTPRLVTNKVTQFGAAQIEHITRKSMYLGFTRMLHENGIKAENGLYEGAQKLTDMAMNNYSHQEAPMAYNAIGGAGRAAYNLMSYKHNELSRISMFVRDVKMNDSVKPLLVSLASQVAFAGIKGTILYAEANEIVKLISAKMGKPTSLNKLIMDFPQLASHGMFSAVGADMTNRLGMSVLPGSAIDAVMPGAGKLVDIGTSAIELVKNPNEYNAKNLARDVAPGALAGPMDRAWFSPENAQGQEMSLNRNKVQATAVRNDADKAWKSIGGTGLNESIQKTRSYEDNQIDKVYSDKRMNVLNNIGKEYFTSGKVSPELAQKYVKFEGDPTTLVKEIERMATEQKVDGPTLQRMRLAATNSIGNAYKLERRMAK